MAVRPSESTMEDGNPEVFCVKWSQHMQLLASNTSKLFGSEKYSDVTLSCTEGKNTEIPAHKMVLSGCSEYFSRLFEKNKLQQPVIVITNVCESTVMQILEYMYKGEVVIPYEEVPKFMNAARTFQVSGLNREMNCLSPVGNDEDVQGKELDLSKNRKVENVPNKTTSNSPAEESPPISKSFIPPPQPALNSALLNHAHLIPIDNHIFNTAALALRNNSQFLSNRLGSPSRISHSAPTLPKRSPSVHLESPKQHLPENHCRDSSAANNRRFSNSPEESVHSNASLDLTKASSSNSPLNRLVSNPLSSLVSAAEQNSHSSINPMSAVIASQLNHYSSFPSQIHVSQSLIHKRSRSKSPESGESKPSQDCADENNTSPRLHDDQGNSPHDSEQSGKQNSSGGASEQYSDDDSGPEAKYNENVVSRTTGNGRAGSVSPGPSTSTPKMSEAFGQALLAGYPRMPWTYGGGDDSKIVTDVPSSQGFWKSSFKNSLLAPYLSSSLPPLSPGSHTTTLSPTFPGLYPPTSLASTWRCPSGSPPPIHAMPFLRSNECARCGRLYKTRKGLKHHIKNECGVEPRFQCTRCDWKFKQKAHLLRHMARKHTPLPDQRCGAS